MTTVDKEIVLTTEAKKADSASSPVTASCERCGESHLPLIDRRSQISYCPREQARIDELNAMDRQNNSTYGALGARDDDVRRPMKKAPAIQPAVVVPGDSKNVLDHPPVSIKIVSSCVICQAPSTLSCGKCRVTYYCSQDHQKQDWKSHKVQCRKLTGMMFEIVDDIGRSSNTDHMSHDTRRIVDHIVAIESDPELRIRSLIYPERFTLDEYTRARAAIAAKGTDVSVTTPPTETKWSDFHFTAAGLSLQQTVPGSFDQLRLVTTTDIKCGNEVFFEKCLTHGESIEKVVMQYMYAQIPWTGVLYPRIARQGVKDLLVPPSEADRIKAIRNKVMMNNLEGLLGEPKRYMVPLLISLIDHGCGDSANCYVYRKRQGKDIYLAIFAMKDIPKGTVLRHAYANMPKMNRAERHAKLKFACTCPVCSDESMALTKISNERNAEMEFTILTSLMKGGGNRGQADAAMCYDALVAALTPHLVM